MARRKSHIVNWQQRAGEFSVGDEVFLFMFGDEYSSGRVVSVYPAIGMVDVEFANGVKRMGVEELQRVKTEVSPPVTDNIPGGAGTVPVSGGPPPVSKEARVRRVAEAFVKKSLYWGSRDRKYRATRGEVDSGQFMCPKCKQAPLGPAIYKRRDGKSEQLLGCHNCLFLIKKIDVIGHPEYVEPKADPLEGMRVAREATVFTRKRRV